MLRAPDLHIRYQNAHCVAVVCSCICQLCMCQEGISTRETPFALAKRAADCKRSSGLQKEQQAAEGAAGCRRSSKLTAKTAILVANRHIQAVKRQWCQCNNKAYFLPAARASSESRFIASSSSCSMKPKVSSVRLTLASRSNMNFPGAVYPSWPVGRAAISPSSFSSTSYTLRTQLKVTPSAIP